VAGLRRLDLRVNRAAARRVDAESDREAEPVIAWSDVVASIWVSERGLSTSGLIDETPCDSDMAVA
jgi:hypothetical protein